MTSAPVSHTSTDLDWTEERLEAFTQKMQLRICVIINHYRSCEPNKDSRPQDKIFLGNLHEELIFTLNVIGHAVLTGTTRPIMRYSVLNCLSNIYFNTRSSIWTTFLAAVDDYYLKYKRHIRDDPRLCFPAWWEQRPYEEFNLSMWIKENLAEGVYLHPVIEFLQKEVDGVLERAEKLSEGIEAQKEFADQFWAAASDEVASSSRDWSSVHAGVQTQYSIKWKDAGSGGGVVGNRAGSNVARGSHPGRGGGRGGGIGGRDGVNAGGSDGMSGGKGGTHRAGGGRGGRRGKAL
ncbi:hypothetical protein PENSPDRAFT_695487 [Peniophora sp. CONT]|nr:hypothetical protein PENSPDRAFT_695487 [Peniophora sp. CONT]